MRMPITVARVTPRGIPAPAAHPVVRRTTAPRGPAVRGAL